MNYGHLLAIRNRSSGCGWRLTATAENLLGSPSGPVMKRPPANCSNRCCQYTPMCHPLHKFLGCLYLCLAVETASSGGQGQRIDPSYRTTEQYVAAADQSPSLQELVISEEIGEPHWHDLVFCTQLQYLAYAVWYHSYWGTIIAPDAVAECDVVDCNFHIVWE